jgi:predicted permease
MPDWRQYVRSHLPPLRLSGAREQEVIEELAQQLEGAYNAARAGGASDEEAEARAAGQFPDWTAVARAINLAEKPLATSFAERLPPQLERLDPLRREKPSMWLDFLQDIRYGIRTLAKTPGLTAIIALTLALGIGANTAIFSVINSVLLRPLPVRDPQQLVVISNPEAGGFLFGTNDGEKDLFSYHEFGGLRDQNTCFNGLFAFDSMGTESPFALGDAEPNPARIGVNMVSGGYFSVLGVQPLKGSVFGDETDRGIGAHAVAVVSYQFWQKQVQADPQVIGRTLRIRQTTFQIVGVMPQSFTGISVGEAPAVWIPLTMASTVSPGTDLLVWKPGTVRRAMFLHVVGRLKPGITVAQANAAINVTFQQVLHTEASSVTDTEKQRAMFNQFVVARSARNGLSELRGEYRSSLFVLMGLVGLVLLLACANVANLLLARATGRRREFAVRLALGASRARLLRQLFTECLLLAALGGLLGLLSSLWGDRLLLRMVSGGPASLPLDVHLDPLVLAFTLAATLLTSVLFGVAPALRSTRLDVNQTLRSTGRSILGGGTGSGRLPMAKLLVGAQVAISLLLLITAGLFVRSLRKISTVDLGYDPNQLFLFRVDPTLSGYKGAAIPEFFRQLLSKVRSIPGVRAATISGHGLFYGADSGDPISIYGYTPKNGQDMDARFDQIGPRYFTSIGIPVLAGRDVGLEDEKGPRSCWLNQTMAREYFGDASPIGHRMSIEYSGGPTDCEIVGVVGDTKFTSLRVARQRRFYVPFLNPVSPDQDAVFEVRYTGDAAAVSDALRRAVREQDSTLDPIFVRTIASLLDFRLVRDRLTARLSAFFGASALLLACLGLYGVLAYNVARRTNEIGVRMALGAEPRNILGLILREAGIVTLVGIVVGMGAALAATRVLATLLFDLSTHDPATLIGCAVILLAVATAAAAIPAWRASRVDPMSALRYE